MQDDSITYQNRCRGAAEGRKAYHEKSNRPEVIEKRFWSNVEKRGPTECWLWTKGTVKGYGRFRVRGKQMLATRFIWELVNGPIPEGMLVCHHCDTPLCCNILHLFIGSTQDNTDDSMRKGRLQRSRVKGEAHSKTTLTTEQVVKIRQVYKNGGKSYSQVAIEFGITKSNVHDVVSGRTWKHVSYGLSQSSSGPKYGNGNGNAGLAHIQIQLPI